MATLIRSWENPAPSSDGHPAENWYAVQTRARHERMVAQRLRERAVNTFLPLMTEVHRWSDRKKTVEVPLFGCYLFARIAADSVERLRVLRVEGVLNLVGSHGEGTPIPDEQIESIQMLIKERAPWHSHPFLKVGQRVRIRSGALDGMEGVLLSHNGDRTLVITIDAIQRSLAVHVEGYKVEAA
jgi:transcription termination/antitermination protein NusG